MKEMYEKEMFEPGDIVLLDRPFKPSLPDGQMVHNVESGEMMPGMEYKSWPGFTHGIIAVVEDGTVFLYLYDPSAATLHMDYRQHMPVRVQFTFDEVQLYKKAGDFRSR